MNNPTVLYSTRNFDKDEKYNWLNSCPKEIMWFLIRKKSFSGGIYLYLQAKSSY
jgi:hypothetical protein